MTITPNSDFSTITIYSDNLLDFTNIDTVVLEGKINCATNSTSDTIVEADVTTGAFTLDYTTLFGLTSLDDNIYGFKLIITMDDSSVITEYGCLFVDNNFRCDIAEKVNEDLTSEINTKMSVYYYVLSNAQDCDCDCSNLCGIYKWLKNELKDCTSC